MSLPLAFKPKKNFKLVRLGRSNDGGYLLGQKTIKATKSIISFGILDDCSFENEFKKVNPVEIFCYDQIDYKSYWIKRVFNDFGAAIFNLNFPFFKNTLIRYFEFKNFFKDKTNVLIKKFIIKDSLNEIIVDKLSNKSPFLVKIDIEGSEYRLLEEIIKHQKFLSGIIIEFHDVDLNKDKILRFIKNFELDLTHLHPNNYGSVDENGDPKVIEMTFEKNPLVLEGNNHLPNDLDQKCDPKKDEINLKFFNEK